MAKIYMQVATSIGAYSDRHSLAKIDGRTKIAKLIRSTHAALVAHVGGHPSATQRALIERVVWLTVKCALIDAKIASGTDTEFDGKSYLAWSNALRRALRDLGMEPAAARSLTLAEVLKAERVA
jgi:hypothetical protein